MLSVDFSEDIIENYNNDARVEQLFSDNLAVVLDLLTVSVQPHCLLDIIFLQANAMLLII